MRAAVFDLDGTLIHTEPRNRLLWRRLFEAHKVPHDDALIASFAGRRGHEVLAELIHLFPGRTAEDLFQEAIAFEEHPDYPAAEPVRGAVDFVRELYRVGVPLGIVTSGKRPYAEGLLEQLGIRALPDVVITADDVAVGKPHPEGFLAACRVLEVEPSKAVGFEDSPAGVAAARAAGMGFVVAVATTQPPELLAEADLVVGDLTELRWPPGQV